MKQFNDIMQIITFILCIVLAVIEQVKGNSSMATLYLLVGMLYITRK